MHRSTLTAVLLSLLSLLLILPVLAQDHVFDLRLAEVNDNGDHTYSNFIYVRNAGSWMFEVFHLYIPGLSGASDYHENTGGVGYTFQTFGDVLIYGLAHLAKGSDEWYFQPALFALDVNGDLTGMAFILYYAPLGDEGLKQILVDPVTVKQHLFGNFYAGPHVYYWNADTVPDVLKLGGVATVVDKFGETSVTFRKVNHGGGWEFQLNRIFLF